jgi:hypothetical protein
MFSGIRGLLVPAAHLKVLSSGFLPLHRVQFLDVWNHGMANVMTD